MVEPLNKIYNNNNIKELFISATRLCNMGCPYCLVQKTVDKYTKEDNNKLIAKIEKFIEKFHHCFDQNLNVCLTGGEILFDLPIALKIIELFNPYTNNFKIFTNGELLGNEKVMKTIFSVAPEASFMIGFDTEQKSVFRFNEKQITSIRQLVARKKIMGLFVIEGKEFISQTAEHLSRIIELLEVHPRIEYNVFKLHEIKDETNVLEELREQLRLCGYKQFKRGVNFNSNNCGMIYIVPDGEMVGCLGQVSKNYTYDKAHEFINTNCKGCRNAEYCRNCEVLVGRYRGEPYCKLMDVLAEGARNEDNRS